MTGQDVLTAMDEMEFERFIGPLKKSLEGIWKTEIYYLVVFIAYNFQETFPASLLSFQVCNFGRSEELL